MYNYIDDVLKEAADNMHGMAVTPASNNLFQVDEMVIKLDKEWAE